MTSHTTKYKNGKYEDENTMHYIKDMPSSGTIVLGEMLPLQLE